MASRIFRVLGYAPCGTAPPLGIHGGSCSCAAWRPVAKRHNYKNHHGFRAAGQSRRERSREPEKSSTPWQRIARSDPMNGGASTFVDEIDLARSREYSLLSVLLLRS